MTREELDFIGALNMCDEISNEAYKKIMCHCEEQETCEDCISRKAVLDEISKSVDHSLYAYKSLMECVKTLPSTTPQEPKIGWIPVSEKYEHHIDHTDCIWYGNDSGCPVTCSQYRDGWNDAMDYIFKNGDGYRPYRRDENG